ncbi:lantibiotic immunity ABC transporter MutG family permease subunit [Paenibacillus sp. NFR01]|uniref:lantibiotic immunity ABC transporter MutG family permease subunit n=1 Tax=Paenibacillus sp. NFR01 TaxID=1566279 RepID=UPI0008B7A173|nr:lantibiotic immunity ABC transporter MutG family permease subunit [Paenibacillus sp. NFR01]SEU09577.1 ABC-2 type transport system permease protein [Paenibacillus sp. NFR01]
MASILGLFRADLLKTRRTPFLLLHLLAPLIAATVFLAYYAYSPWSATDKVQAYLQVLGCALPTLIALVCSMSAEQEALAGHFQGLLALPAQRIKVYASKLLLLLIYGLGAILLAVLLFGIGFREVLGQDGLGMAFYWSGAGILFGSSTFLYLLHSFVSLRFGRGPSIGTGIVGSLIAALLLTGLGERLWVYVPFAWGARLISIWTVHAAGTPLPLTVSQANTGITVCILATLTAAVLSCLWFRRWEGRSADA